MKPLQPEGRNHQGIPNIEIIQRDYVLFAESPEFPCLKCSDAPCINQSNLTSPAEMLIKGSNLPDHSVCPTKSINQNMTGDVEVNTATCFGCGLCVSLCPVNSLTLSSMMHPTSQKTKLEDVGNLFEHRRNEISTHVRRNKQNISSIMITSSSLCVKKLLDLGLDRRSFQIYVRNIFLKSGFKCRIRIEGDNNDSFEMVAETQEFVYPIEISLGGDTLDSTRRILSGCATLISKGIVSMSRLRPILIVEELPNSRSDIYRIAEDMQKYLSLELRIIPISILQLLSYAEISLQKYFISTVEPPAHEWYWRSLLVVSNATENELGSLKLTK